jgi:hypothetical protein
MMRLVRLKQTRLAKDCRVFVFSGVAMIISFQGNIERIRNQLGVIRREVVNKATVRALNKTGAIARTAASREIRQAGYNIAARAIKDNVELKRARPGELRVTVRAAGRPVPLIAFGARQTRAGVSVKVKEGRKLIKGAFIATMPTGHKGVFTRVGNRHKRVRRDGRASWSGLPIREMYGPSVPAAFRNQVVQDALRRVARARFPAIFEHELRYLLRR